MIGYTMEPYGVFVVVLFNLIFLISPGSCLQCYQCDSNEDNSCPYWLPFDRNINALVDCQSFETRIPGTFCLKITQQSPGWYGWIKQTRRCGSRSDTGVAWGCRWLYQDNGVWKEMCYCDTQDGCNKATSLPPASVTILACLCSILAVQIARFWH